MRLPIYQVAAFAEQPFAGNPAAVIPLEVWPDDRTLQAIAAENNLPETAFLVRRPAGSYEIRWFTPTVEVDLCGHATLASGHVVMTSIDPGAHAVSFDSRFSGPPFRSSATASATSSTSRRARPSRGRRRRG